MIPNPWIKEGFTKLFLASMIGGTYPLFPIIDVNPFINFEGSSAATTRLLGHLAVGNDIHGGSLLSYKPCQADISGWTACGGTEVDSL